MNHKYLKGLNNDTFLKINKTKHFVVKTGNIVKSIEFNSNRMLNVFNLDCFQPCTEIEFRENYTKVLKALIL